MQPVTCLDQSDGPVCCSILWSIFHKHVPGIHLILQGPRSFRESCCLFLPRSLCWSPKGGAVGNESPVVGSNHLTSLKKKANKLILCTMHQRTFLLDKAEVTQVRHKPGWKSVRKPFSESWDTLTQPVFPSEKQSSLGKLYTLLFHLYSYIFLGSHAIA